MAAHWRKHFGAADSSGSGVNNARPQEGTRIRGGPAAAAMLHANRHWKKGGPAAAACSLLEFVGVVERGEPEGKQLVLLPGGLLPFSIHLMHAALQIPSFGCLFYP